MTALDALRGQLLTGLTGAGFRDGQGVRVALSTIRDPETYEQTQVWEDQGEAFACGLRPVMLTDAVRQGITLSEADFMLHLDAGISLKPDDRVRVSDPRHPDGVLLEILRVQAGPVKTVAQCKGVTV